MDLQDMSAVDASSLSRDPSSDLHARANIAKFKAEAEKLRDWLKEHVPDDIVRDRKEGILVVKYFTIQDVLADGTLLLMVYAVDIHPHLVQCIVHGFRFEWTLQDLQANISRVKCLPFLVSQETLTAGFYGVQFAQERQKAEERGQDLDEEFRQKCSTVKKFIKQHVLAGDLRENAKHRKLRVKIKTPKMIKPQEGLPVLLCPCRVRALCDDGNVHAEYTTKVHVEPGYGSVLGHTFEWELVRSDDTALGTSGEWPVKAAKKSPRKSQTPLEETSGAAGGADYTEPGRGSVLGHTFQWEPVRSDETASGTSGKGPLRAAKKRPRKSQTLLEETSGAAGGAASTEPSIFGMVRLNAAEAPSVKAQAKKNRTALQETSGSAHRARELHATKLTAKGQALEPCHKFTQQGWRATYHIDPENPRIRMDKTIHGGESLGALHRFLNSEGGKLFRQFYKIDANPSERELDMWFRRLNFEREWMKFYKNSKSRLNHGMDVPLYCTFCPHIARCQCHYPDDAEHSKEALEANQVKWHKQDRKKQGK